MLKTHASTPTPPVADATVPSAGPAQDTAARHEKLLQTPAALAGLPPRGGAASVGANRVSGAQPQAAIPTYMAAGSAQRSPAIAVDARATPTSSAEIEPVAQQIAEQVAAVVGAPLQVPPADPEQARFHLEQTKADYGATAEQFERFVADAGAVFAPSASAGRRLERLNDHDGILVLPAQDGDLRIAERLAVIKDTAGADEQPRFFVKGYGDRVVRFEDLRRFLLGGQADADRAAPAMETEFRGQLLALSRESTLFARRDEQEALGKLTQLPVAPARLQLRPESWANSENYMPHGAGPRNEAGFHRLYMDYNRIENRILFFKNDSGLTERAPNEDREGAVNVSGALLAEVHGIKNIEVMGPAGHEPGVKGAKFRRAKQGEAPSLRVTTEDGAVHHVVLSERGIKMSLVNPQPTAGNSASGAAFGQRQRVQADVDLYSYHGQDTGPTGSADGFADPRLLTSTRESLAAGPLVRNRSGWGGNLVSLAHAGVRLVTFQSHVGESRSALAHYANVALTALTKGLIVYGFNEALKALQELHVKGTVLGGGRAFSATGAGSADSATLAGAVVSMVVVQEAMTTAFNLIGRVIPPDWKNPETATSEMLMNAVLPAAQEFSRLLVNYGLQKSIGLHRGGSNDVAMLAVASVISGGLQLTKSRAGEPQNHAAVEASLNIANFANDTLFRSLGNVLSSGFENSVTRDASAQLQLTSTPINGSFSASALAEAVAARLLTRGYDKLVAPLVATVLNAYGVIGPNASAFDHQISRETRGAHAVTFLKKVTDSLAQQTSKTGDAMAQWKVVHQTLEMAVGALEGTQKFISHLGLKAEEAIEHEVEAAQLASRFSTLSPNAQAEALEAMNRTLQSMVLGAERLSARSSVRIEEVAETSDIARVGSNSRKELPPGHQRVMRSLEKSLDLAREKDPVTHHYAVEMSLDGKMRPAGARVARFGSLHDTATVPTDVTTFSRTAQRYAKPTHDQMIAAAGISSALQNPAFSAQLKSKMERAVRGYTIESQFFHYPLRWNQTGQDKLQPIAPGIDFIYKVMNKPGNTAGEADKQFDPVQAIYINLAALHAEKFPAVAERAVVTDAVYLPDAARRNEPGVVSNGDTVALTEIFSATMSSRLAASFGQALGFGASQQSRSQRLVIAQETGVNITRYTDLVQAELISMPGALFNVEYVDPNAGKKPDQQMDADIGQVVYLKQIDTYELESRFNAYQRGELDTLPDGAMMLDGRSGHFYSFDADSGERAFVSVAKNYFLGSKLERDQPEQAGQKARWRHPYTSDYAPRSTKDAVHAAILRGDSIVPHLDEATSNVHHEHFRVKGGFYDTVEGQQLQAQHDETKAAARAIARTFMDLGLQTPLQGLIGGQAEMMAWILTSMLRKPIALVPVDAGGGVLRERLQIITMTYDKVDLSEAKAAKIGLDEGGVYSIRDEQDRLVATPIRADGEGPTVSNLLHALVHADFPRAGTYQREADEAADVLIPDRAARNSVIALLAKLQTFILTDFIVLQEALIEKSNELENRQREAAFQR